MTSSVKERYLDVFEADPFSFYISRIERDLVRSICSIHAPVNCVNAVKMYHHGSISNVSTGKENRDEFDFKQCQSQSKQQRADPGSLTGSGKGEPGTSL